MTVVALLVWMAGLIAASAVAVALKRTIFPYVYKADEATFALSPERLEQLERSPAAKILATRYFFAPLKTNRLGEIKSTRRNRQRF